ncbi:RNA polymerase sigma-70 factor, ECF subfamily [Chitinophaga sp. YR627]|uniref:RNA polymerase sigma factor n=1 Tax=Chitinophaga sp. YR627 TaxID=1881041 RepID=UPI0008E3F449|nr:RNA polymerase sigma-70 factor [Chitinophaga sp. YR627]SFO52095.1 RNA polymerase sigma-70 factor, ECF subfamily [Chitinophaga sp. YR627]
MNVYQQFTDQQLADLLKSGDQQAYIEIYNRYIFVLLNHTYNKTGNREEAKDIVHEVFAKLWANREQLQIMSSLAGFLYTSARNIVLNQITHKKIEEKYFNSIQQFLEQPQTITDHRVRENQLIALIEKEIAALPPKMREVFELSRKQHLSHKEIAEKLDISEQTVSKHVTNALKILRIKLGFFAYLLWIIYPK